MTALSLEIDALSPSSAKAATSAEAAGAAAAGKHGQERPDSSKARALPAAVDITVHAHPSTPPYASILTAAMAGEHDAASTSSGTCVGGGGGGGGGVHVRQFWHSSAPPMPAGFRSANAFESKSCSLRLNVVWSGSPTTQMVVSSSAQVPVQGDTNVARYLARAAAVGCSFLYPQDPVSALSVDTWVDIAASMIGGATKEQKAAMKSANLALSKSPWLAGGKSPSLADACLWSSIRAGATKGALPGNVKKWKIAMDELPAVIAAEAIIEASCTTAAA